MQENKSSGVDEIPPKIMKETSKLVCLLHLQEREREGPLERKKPNIIPLKVHRPSISLGRRSRAGVSFLQTHVSRHSILPVFRRLPIDTIFFPHFHATSMCELLETIIRDHMVNFLIKHKLINPSQHVFLKLIKAR